MAFDPGSTRGWTMPFVSDGAPRASTRPKALRSKSWMCQRSTFDRRQPSLGRGERHEGMDLRNHLPMKSSTTWTSIQ